MVSEHLKKGGKALILTDRIELLKQANGSFTRFLLSPELITAGREPDLMKSLHISMIETISRRAERYNNFIATRTLIVIDEAHKTAFEKIFPFISDTACVIGATATPFRSGSQSSLDAFYSDIVQEVDTPDLIKQGFLSDAITYGVDIDLKGVKKKAGEYDSSELGKIYNERKIYDGVIENYNRICPGSKALLFAPNIESSKKVCSELLAAGIPAMHLDGEMNKSEREFILSRFNDLKHIILCNCGVLTTGFDQPDIETIILYRATTSLPLFLQMVGRGSRITPSKSKFTILDFGNNIKTHNFWESPREWSLKKKEKSKGVPPIKTCPECGAMVPVSTVICGTELPPFTGNFCQYEWKRSPEEIEKNEFAELKLLSPQDRMNIALSSDLKKRAKMAKEKLISPMWVLHTLDNPVDAEAFIAEMGYKPEFKYHIQDRVQALVPRELPTELINNFGKI